MTRPPRSLFWPCFFGLIYGLLYTISHLPPDFLTYPPIEGIAVTILLPLSLRLYQRFVWERVFKASQADPFAQRFYRCEPYTYAVFMLGIAFLLGVMPSIALTFAIWILFLIVQVGLYFYLLDPARRTVIIASEKYVAVLFLVSGFSALIYQVVWQRTLFSTFGINSESVTVIVSVFMFGLGIGALAGGYLQKRYPRHLLRLFLLLEVSIGLFGTVSLPLIHHVGALSGNSSAAMLVFWVYLILAIPTLLMGATLPILVAWLQGYLHNIGRSVGMLYAFNTMGSAIAAFLTVQLLFVFLGQQATVYIAAACNFATAFLIFDAGRRFKQSAREQPGRAPELAAPDRPRLPYAFVFGTLLAIGYISLSQEILWFRLLAYLTASAPQAFGLMLAAFLVGIATGSIRSKRVCEGEGKPFAYLVHALFCTIILFYIALPAVALAASLIQKNAGTVLAYLAIGFVAYYTGGILPMLVHLGTENTRSNSTQAMSWLYFANIIGATFGPLLTGFILLDHFSLEANIVLLTGMAMLLLSVVLLVVPSARQYKVKAFGALLALLLVGGSLHEKLFDAHLERLFYGATGHAKFKAKLENMSGIITVEASPDGDIMNGNGIYDGRFNLDATNDSNLISRAYMFAALHRSPKEVLEIGLSTGSWAKVMAQYAPLTHLTAIEINKGYPASIQNYSEILPILSDPKVSVEFDDGRRWLRNHPERRFDFILMNTSFHWRSNMSNLLSAEFLELAKRHLKPGGVVYYNTTNSPDVIYTAATVFKHVTTFINFVAASDSPFDMSEQERAANLNKFINADGAPVFEVDAAHRRLASSLAATALPELHDQMLARHDLWRVTDDNMAVEFKVPHR